MNSLSAKFNKVYGSDATEMKVLSASPVEIIILLYEGAVAALLQAEQAVENGDIPRKINRLNKALDIIDGLAAALNHEKGGDIASNLGGLYEYMKVRLSMANLKNDKSMMADVRLLLTDLLTAWVEIGGRGKTSVDAPLEQALTMGGSYGKI